MKSEKICKNCSYWMKTSKKYGKCPMIGAHDQLRSGDKAIFAMTPYYATCNLYNNEKKTFRNSDRGNK